MHGRNPNFKPNSGQLPSSTNLEYYKNNLEAIKKKTPEILINLSTSIGYPAVTAIDRIRPAVTFKSELGSLNTNTMNFAIRDRKKGKGSLRNSAGVFTNTFETIIGLAEIMRDNQIRPEIEIYDLGGMYNILFLMEREDLFTEPMYFQLVFGVLGGVPFNVSTLSHFLETMPKGSNWSVCGVSKDQIKAAMCAITQGGHVRVGLEDSVRNYRGELAAGSQEQVEWAAKVIELAGLEVATTEETREILKLRVS